MRYQCDFVIQTREGQTHIREIRVIEAPDLAQAVRWLESKLLGAPEAFGKVYAVRLRHSGKVVWLKALGSG